MVAAAGGANPSSVMTFRLRDELSPGLSQIGTALDTTDAKADNLSAGFQQLSASTAQAEQSGAGFFNTFQRSSGSMIIAGAAIASAGASIAQLGTSIGLIPERMQKTVSNTVAAAGAVAALAGAFGTLIPLIINLARAEKVRAIASAVALAFSNPFLALGALAIAAAVGIGAAALIGSFQTSAGQRRQIPGSTTTAQLALVHGGEIIGRPDTNGNGVSRINEAQSVINVGILVADENGIRELERRLGRVRQEGRRTRGITT